MKTKYKYIHFTKVAESEKTTTWSCINNKSGYELGRVMWHRPWRQYCYFPTTPAIYSRNCLDDISDFINELNVEEGRT